MVFKKNNIVYNKSLNELENIPVPRPHEFESYLVKRCYDLANKKLKFFSPEDIRMMIGQNWGLEYLIEMAIEILKETPFIETDLFKGDLFLYVLEIDEKYWESNINQKQIVCQIFKDNLTGLKELNSDIQQDLYEAYDKIK